MCYINWSPDGYDPPASLCVRPAPQLKWATPVDIVELGASLEAFLAQLSQILSLRLCHRYGDSSLSKVPQEILDHIISDIHHAYKDLIRPEWDRKLRCFQGRCNRQDHVNFSQEIDYEELWEAIYVEGRYGSGVKPLWREDFTKEQVRKMVDEEMEEEGYLSWDDDILENHWDKQHQWLKMVCTCKKMMTTAQLERPTFRQLLNVVP